MQSILLRNVYQHHKTCDPSNEMKMKRKLYDIQSFKCLIFSIGVETKSTVSDTWSTDVLASDSEPPPEGNQYDRLEELVRSSFLPRQEVRATTDI